jgi:hypothetical protein
MKRCEEGSLSMNTAKTLIVVTFSRRGEDVVGRVILYIQLAFAHFKQGHCHDRQKQFSL